MRPATKEERESVDRYIESISHKTGIVCAAGNVDYEDDFDFIAEHPKADMSNVNRIRINGKLYLAADEIMEIMTEAERHDQYFRYAYGEIEKLKGGEQK